MKSAKKIEPLPGNGKAMPPSLFFAQVYFEQKNRTLLEATNFFQFYAENKWTSPRGKKIRDWKAAANNWIWNIKQQEKAMKTARKKV